MRCQVCLPLISLDEALIVCVPLLKRHKAVPLMTYMDTRQFACLLSKVSLKRLEVHVPFYITSLEALIMCAPLFVWK